MTRPAFVGVVSALLLAGASASFAAGTTPLPPPSALPPPPGYAAGAKPGSPSPSPDTSCLVEPHLIAEIGSPVEGTLAQVMVDRGSDVHVGQAVARLNSGVEAATLTLKKAQADFDERKVERNEDLFKKNLIAASDKDEMETQTHMAQLEVRQQQEVLNMRTIVSPVSGVVVERYLSPGNHVSQEKILKIAQIDPLNIEMVVPVSQFGSIKVGEVGVVSLAPLISGDLKAKVVVVDRVIDAASGTFGVRLELPNPGNKIPSGLKCSVQFQKP